MFRNLLQTSYWSRLSSRATLHQRYRNSSYFTRENLEQYKEVYGAVEVKALTKEEDIFKAKHLYYRYFIESRYNLPLLIKFIGVEFHTKDNVKYATDIFDGNSYWTGAFFKGQLIAVERMIFKTKNNVIEFQMYQDSKKPNIMEKLQNKRLVELGRAYTLPEYRGFGVTNLVNKLDHKILEHAQHDGIVITSHQANWHKFGIGEKLDNCFQYKELKLPDCYPIYYLSQDHHKTAQTIFGKYVDATVKKLNSLSENTEI